MGKGKYRLGGSSLAHVYGQIGHESPDIDDVAILKQAFEATQRLIEEDLILSGHDISDGGLIVALLEMAFSGNCGFHVDIKGGTEEQRDLGSETLPLEAPDFSTYGLLHSLFCLPKRRDS